MLSDALAVKDTSNSWNQRWVDSFVSANTVRRDASLRMDEATFKYLACKIGYPESVAEAAARGLYLSDSNLDMASVPKDGRYFGRLPTDAEKAQILKDLQVVLDRHKGFKLISVAGTGNKDGTIDTSNEAIDYARRATAELSDVIERWDNALGARKEIDAWLSAGNSAGAVYRWYNLPFMADADSALRSLYSSLQALISRSASFQDFVYGWDLVVLAVTAPVRVFSKTTETVANAALGAAKASNWLLENWWVVALVVALIGIGYAAFMSKTSGLSINIEQKEPRNIAAVQALSQVPVLHDASCKCDACSTSGFFVGPSEAAPMAHDFYVTPSS